MLRGAFDGRGLPQRRVREVSCVGLLKGQKEVEDGGEVEEAEG